MKILVLEDRGVVLYPLREMLEALGHVVLCAFNIAEARAIWKRKKSDIAALIVDLNVSADALAKAGIESKAQGIGGADWRALAGWIWLEQENLVGEPRAKGSPKIIVLSAYLEVWKDMGCEEKNYSSVTFIRKSPEIVDDIQDCIAAVTTR